MQGDLALAAGGRALARWQLLSAVPLDPSAPRRPAAGCARGRDQPPSQRPAGASSSRPLPRELACASWTSHPVRLPIAGRSAAPGSVPPPQSLGGRPHPESNLEKHSHIRLQPPRYQEHRPSVKSPRPSVGGLLPALPPFSDPPAGPARARASRRNPNAWPAPVQLLGQPPEPQAIWPHPQAAAPSEGPRSRPVRFPLAAPPRPAIPNQCCRPPPPLP